MDLANINNAINTTYEQNPQLKLWVILVTSILIGYVLQPVPEWLNNMFNNNIYLKFYIIFMTGLIWSVPLKDNILVYNFVFALVLLFIMEQARGLDKKKAKK